MKAEPLYRGGNLVASIEETATNTAPDYSPAAALEGVSAGPRFPLGLPGLTALVRGGVPPGTLIAATGAPGTGKSAFAVTLAAALRGSGVVSVILAPDEGRRRAAIRAGQALGLSREDLEAGRPEAVAELRQRAGDSIHLLPDETTIEEALAFCRTIATGGRRVCFAVDSLQRARTESGERELRLRLEAAVTAIRVFCNESGALAIVVSEANRASYRGGTEVAPIASGAETRALEFAPDLVIHLRDSEGMVAAAVLKNREGDHGTVLLRLDRVTGLLDEVEAREAELLAAECEGRRLGKLGSRVLDVLGQHGELSGRGIRELVGGRAADVSAAIERLRLARRVEARPGPNRSTIFSLAKGSGE